MKFQNGSFLICRGKSSNPVLKWRSGGTIEHSKALRNQIVWHNYVKTTWKKTADHVQMIRTQKESDFSTETGVRRQ